MDKTYGPKPPQHAVEVDLDRVEEARLGEVKGLILKNHLPNAPFGIRFGNQGEIEIKINEIKVEGNKFKVFWAKKENEDYKDLEPIIDNNVNLKAHNGTYERITEEPNMEINYKGAFEKLVLTKLKEQNILV